MELYRDYTPSELKKLFGNDWSKKLGLLFPPKIINKPIINNFIEFDEYTKSIYIAIYNCVKEKNPNKDIKVWATGSRIKGYWRTKEEAEQLALDYNKPIKYSDYDYRTDAANKPTEAEFLNKIGVKVDLSGGEDRKVLVEI